MHDEFKEELTKYDEADNENETDSTNDALGSLQGYVIYDGNSPNQHYYLKVEEDNPGEEHYINL